jgi:hypothetical protein
MAGEGAENHRDEPKNPRQVREKQWRQARSMRGRGPVFEGRATPIEV